MLREGSIRMKRNSKRFLSLFLSVPVALSVVAAPVYATPENGAVEDSTVVEDTATPGVETTQKDKTPEEETIPETEDSTESNEEETEQETEQETTDEVVTPDVESMISTFTVDSSKISLPEINVNEMKIEDERAVMAVNETDPEIAGIKEELQSITVLNEDGESVPLTEEQIQTVLYMFTQYTDQWKANADVLGVQTPFFLQFNDKNEDGLGVLGEMLVLANVSVDDVRSGNYSYDDLCGMIMNFLYGDQLGIQYYGNAIRAKRDEAIKAVEESGAKTAVQKLLVLNDWLAQSDTFDMAYIMNQMGDDPAMVAENPKAHPHHDDVYNVMVEVYRPQITAQFHDPIYAAVEEQFRLQLYQDAIKELYMQANPDATDEDFNAYMEENQEAINKDAIEFIKANYGEEAAAQIQQSTDEALASEEVKAKIEEITKQQMDQPMEDLGGKTANQAIEEFTAQAAEGLTGGIIGYWSGNQFGALAEGKSVCMGYAKAYAYLMQCIYPEYYGVNGAETDMTVAENWKEAKDLYYDEEGNLDINQDYNVDLVRITFDAAVTMYGEPQPEFSSDHFWNAVKVDGQWYYVDPCYTDSWSEVMTRDRVETDGYMNHLYFMMSHTTTAEMYEGNYKEIKGLYNEAATNKQYEDSWVSRISGNAYSDGEYFYYLYDSTDTVSLLEDFNDGMEGMTVEDPVYKLVRHKITDSDTGDGDTDYEALIEFNYKESEDADTSVARVLNPSNGKMEENEMLTDMYARFEKEKDIYPSIHITPVLYEGKIYFNVSNAIFSYDLSTGAVVRVKEYNTVYGVRDDSVVFGGMGFSTTNSAEGADFTIKNHPLAGMSLKQDGNLYVSVATNVAYISGKNPHDYLDKASYGWEFEESNYNPNYSEFMNNKMDDSGISDDMLEQMGYKKEINDNSEFMWVTNFVETLNMSHLAGSSHTYSAVDVDAYCDEDSYTENRCTECGAIEADTRAENKDTAIKHHYVKFDEEYYTKDKNKNWNTGSSYVCTVCGFSVSEPTEPKKTSNESEEDYQKRLEQYKKDKEIYDEAVKSAGHKYAPTDAQWSEDCFTVTFSGLECSSICPERKNSLDCLINDNTVSVNLTQPVTAEAKLAKAEGTCAEGVTSTYTASGEVEGYKYKLSNTVTWPAGDHNFVNGKCTKCGEVDPSYLKAPVIDSVYSKKQTTAKATWGILDNAVGYQLYRAESPDAPEEDWTLVKTINSSNMDQYTKDDTIQYTNVDLEVGKTYYYKVRAFALKNGATDENDEASRVYSEFSEVKYMPAAVVLGDVYSAATDKVRINWNAVKGAHGYQIWCKDNEGEYSIVKTLGDKGNELTNDQGATTGYSKYDLKSGKTYTFKMRAFMIPGDGTKVFGAFSDEVKITVMPKTTTLSAKSTKAGKTDLSWEKVSGADGYQIWMSTSNSDSEYKITKVIEKGDVTSYVKSDLKSGTTYYFKVRAYADNNGKKTYGEYSKAVSVKVK